MRTYRRQSQRSTKGLGSLSAAPRGKNDHRVDLDENVAIELIALLARMLEDSSHAFGHRELVAMTRGHARLAQALGIHRMVPDYRRRLAHAG